MEALISIFAALLTMAGFAVASSGIFGNPFRKGAGTRAGEGAKTQPKPEKLYRERLSDLTRSLAEASKDVDMVISELTQVARDREFAVEKLESELQLLEGREIELKNRIDSLESTPIPVAEHFAKMLEEGDKNNARRDYFLFGAGVVVTTIVAIIIQVATG